MKMKTVFVPVLCIALCSAAGCSAGTAETGTVTSDISGYAADSTETQPAGISDDLTDKEIAALKGWWSREGIFYDGTNLARISFRSINGGYEENTWFANGVFGDDRFWSGNVKLTGEGLEGTVETGKADENFLSEENRSTAQVRITEEGEYSIMLIFGNGEEYHLTLLTELEP